MILRLPALAAFTALTLLAACGESGGGGTDISITGTDDAGKPAGASVDGETGRVKVDVPGVKVDLALPKITLDADNFDISGVKLYPGSTVSGVNVLTSKEGDGNDQVKISFDSPAAPDKVGAWFAEKMKEKGFEVTVAGTTLSGKTDEADPFTLQLVPGANGHSTGTLNIKG